MNEAGKSFCFCASGQAFLGIASFGQLYMRAWINLTFKASPSSSECFPELWCSPTSPFPAGTTQYLPRLSLLALAPWLKASTSETTGGYFPSAGACSEGADVALARGPGMASQCSQNGQKLRCWSWVVPLALGPEDNAAGSQHHTVSTSTASAYQSSLYKAGVLGARSRRVTAPDKYQAALPIPVLLKPMVPPFFFLKNKQDCLPGTPSFFFLNIQHVGINGGSNSSWY